MDWRNLKTFGERLNFLLGDTTNAEVEKKSGISNELIGLWRRGKGNPTLEKLAVLQKVFKQSFIWLVTGEGEPYPEDSGVLIEGANDVNVKYTSTKFKNIPIVGSVPCGLPVASWNIDYNKLLKLADVGHFNSPFILKADGDSMSPYINNKDLLLCSDEPEKVKKNGKAVVVSFVSDNDNITANAKLIKWEKDKKHVTLYSVNTKYEPVTYSINEIYKIYKVVRIIREVN